MAQFEFVEWLFLWLLETVDFHFEWDSGNRAKSLVKHDVFPEEVEEVFFLGQALPLGIQVSPATDEERLGIVGPTAANRFLMIAFTLREGKVRPISARPAHRKEREQYEALLRKISEGV